MRGWGALSWPPRLPCQLCQPEECHSRRLSEASGDRSSGTKGVFTRKEPPCVHHWLSPCSADSLAAAAHCKVFPMKNVIIALLYFLKTKVIFKILFATGEEAGQEFFLIKPVVCARLKQL